METIGVEKALGALKELIKKVGMAIAELLIDFTAIAVSMVVSLVIPSILPMIPEFMPVAVGGAASLITLTIADLKKLLRKIGEK